MRLIDADELLNDLIFPTEQFKRAFTELINDAPTIEAEPTKHGRWEMYGAITRGTLAIPIYRCSECKEDTNNWFWHYCPKCGADMREGEKNEQNMDTR